tara:strand:- start:3260 stop:5068 length:1809 start_codon:yes stop_codon:yes gene_type:complete
MAGVVPCALNQMVSAFAARGFKRYSGLKGVSLQGQIDVNGIKFNLLVTNLDPTFAKLPSVYLSAIPEGLPRRLPHVEGGLKLCYLDPESVFLDPYRPLRTTQLIIGAIEKLLSTFVDGSDVYKQGEIAREFYSYWNYEAVCFLTTKQKNAIGCAYQRRSLDGSVHAELAVASDLDRMEFWKVKRKVEPLEKDDILYGSIIINLKATPTITDDLSEWPPQSWESFLAWLVTFDPSAQQSLISNLHLALKKYIGILIILDSELSGPFAVSVVFTPETFSRIRKFNLTNRKSSKNRSNNRKGGRGHVVGFREFRDFISKNKRVKSFFRMQAIDVTENFIVDRNLSVTSLSGRKIAVIGCGTVGGFVADLLVKAGAGMGESGLLTLFDSDLFGAGNLGRHILGVQYLNMPKGRAMSSYLNEKTSYGFKVEGRADLAVQQTIELRSYDMIVDLTGNENFSTLLAHEIHRLRAGGIEMPPILHFWIDAGGRAIRGLLDDGKHACYRCLRQYGKGRNDSEELLERFPLYLDSSKENDPVAVHRCGDSYIPFPAGMSVIAAGQLQSIVLDYFSGMLKDTFYHYSTNPEIKVTKNKKLNRMADCPCCTKRP